MSVSTENFVKTIFIQQQISGADTKPGTVAKLLNITSAAATDMARKLAAKNIVDYTRYKQLSLTLAGKKMALNVIRKHRLWESFLYKTLNLSLHEIHREAEMLEHFTSDFLAEKIDNFLGNPSTDPHGDPIPAFNSDISFSSDNVTLSKARAGCCYIVSRLFSSEEVFFDFCTANRISLGANIKVEKQYEKQQMTEVVINKNKLLLNREFANIIYVKEQN